jgi:hypothetical protein
MPLSHIRKSRLNSTILDLSTTWGEESASRSSRFTHEERTVSTHRRPDGPHSPSGRYEEKNLLPLSRIERDPRVHYLIHKKPSLDPILR